MKLIVAMIIAVATLFVGTAQESQAQFYRGGSGFSISIGSGGFGGYPGGFGGYGGGFNRGYGGGFGGYGGGYGRVYNSYRPVYGGYGRSYARPVYSNYGRSYGGGGRSCGGW